MENIKTSETISEFAKALLLFQGEVETIAKKADNPFFKSKYASLEIILPVIQPALQKAKLSFTQIPCGENNLTTIIFHESGEYLMGSYHIEPVKEYKKIEAVDVNGVIIMEEKWGKKTPKMIIDKETPAYTTPQTQGSAITYARRYALVSMLGLNCDKDDDGNQASGKGNGVTDRNDAPFGVNSVIID